MGTQDKSNRKSTPNQVFGISRHRRWQEPAVADAATQELERQEEAHREAEKRIAISELLRRAYNAKGRKNVLSYQEFWVASLKNKGWDDPEIAEFLETSINNVRKTHCNALKKLTEFASA